MKRPLDLTVHFFTAAAPPLEKPLADIKEAGFDVTHLYGLTEICGPAVAVRAARSIAPRAPSEVGAAPGAVAAPGSFREISLVPVMAHSSMWNE